MGLAPIYVRIWLQNTHRLSYFPLFSFLFFLSLLVCFCIYISSLSLPWYSRIWRPWAFWERWELDKGCVKRVFLGLNRCRGYRSSWGFLVCGIAHSTRSTSHFLRISHSRNFTRPTSHIHPDISYPESCLLTFHPPGYLTSGAYPPTFHPPGYLTSWILSADIPSTRISHIRNPVRRHSIHPDISHPESCPPTFYPPWYLTSGILSADIPSTRISHIRRLSPDGRGGRFNFLGQTCPNLLVTPIRSVRLTCLRSPHLAPGVWTTKSSGFPCFSPRLSWVQDLPMRPISPGLNQVAKGLTTTPFQIKDDLGYHHNCIF